MIHQTAEMFHSDQETNLGRGTGCPEPGFLPASQSPEGLGLFLSSFCLIQEDHKYPPAVRDAHHPLLFFSRALLCLQLLENYGGQGRACVSVLAYPRGDTELTSLVVRKMSQTEWCLCITRQQHPLWLESHPEGRILIWSKRPHLWPDSPADHCPEGNDKAVWANSRGPRRNGS